MVFRSRVTGNVLPNARRVSVAIHSEAEGPETDPNVHQLPNMSIVAMTFAQFLDHDLTLTPGRLRTKAFRHIEHNTHGAVKTTEWAPAELANGRLALVTHAICGPRWSHWSQIPLFYFRSFRKHDTATLRSSLATLHWTTLA